MAFVIADRVRETTTTIGTGSITLAGAYTSFQSFSAAIGNGNNTYYTIASASSGEWEVGIGTYSSGGNLLSRDTVLSSSNAGNLVNFSVGSKDVFVTQPSERSLLINAASNGLFAGNASFTANGVPYANSTTTLTTGSALTFDGTGKLGVGTTTPVSGVSAGFEAVGEIWATTASSNANQIRLSPSTSGANIIYSTYAGAGSYLPLAFNVSGSEQMRLTSTGLGIGTSSVGSRLMVAGSFSKNTSDESTWGVRVQDETAMAAGVGGSIVFTGNYTSGGAKASFAAIAASKTNSTTSNGLGDLKFYTTNSSSVLVNNMTLDSSGNLTLASPGTFTYSSGTANGVAYLNGSKVLTSGSALTFDGTSLDLGVVGAKLNFATTGSATRNYVGVSADGYSLEMVMQRGASQPISYKQDFSAAAHIYSIAGSEQMRLTSTGLGIGTSSPQARLHINSGAGSTQFRMGPNSTSSDRALINYNSTTNRFTIDMSGNDAVVVDGSGNLGLGVTPSAWGSDYKAFQFGGSATGSISNKNFVTSVGINFYSTNSNDVALVTGNAAKYEINGSGEHVWKTAATTAGNTISFTQAMTLDASGNLGVGTTSPSTRIHAVATGGAIRMQDSAGTAKYVQMRSDSTNSHLEHIGGPGDALRINNQAAGTIEFFTSNTERARITSGGYFKASNDGTYVGSTASYHELRVTGAAGDWNTVVANATATAANAFGIRVAYTGSAPNGTGNAFLSCDDTGATRFVARSNGGLANYSANDVNLSDRREKTNFAPAKSYLDTICAIPVQTFNYIDQSEDDPGLTLGVVAQDVQAVAPELVMESNWGTEDNPKMRLSIYQTDLQYALMKALQELKSELDSVKAELATLKGA